MFTGLPERLTKEIRSLAKEHMKEKVKVIYEKDRIMLPYIGGNIFAHTFAPIWISRTEYEENGNSIIHKKCPIF
jgi:actin-related protein